MTRYEKHCREVCELCRESVVAGNVTGMRGHYKNSAKMPLSCTAPTREAFAEQMADRAEKAEAAMKWLDANRMILSMVLRDCDGQRLPSQAIEEAMLKES